MTLLKLHKSLVLTTTGVASKPLMLRQQGFCPVYANTNLVLSYGMSASIAPQMKFLNKKKRDRSKPL